MSTELQANSSGNLNKTGFYIAFATALLTLFTFIIAFLTPPLSGPFCQDDCFQYPYHTIASRFPRDYYWMFPAMALCILYVIFILIICESEPNPKSKIWGKTAIVMAIMSSTVLLICYYTQVTVIQPSLLNNETEGIALWSQFNPHGLFIALEELGYILMNLSFFFCCTHLFHPGKTETNSEMDTNFGGSYRYIITVGNIT
jgi:uncharacterized membrane protein YhaH (DUF805 family)